MKTVNAILGAIITFFLLLGVMFKIMHWPGAGPLIVVFTSLLSMYMIPVAIGNILSYEKKTLIGICNGIGAFGGMVLSIGLLFKIMHWPGSGVMMYIGFLFLIIVILFFLILYAISKEPIKLSSGTLFSAICFGLLLYAVSIGSSSKSLLVNVVKNAVNIEQDYKEVETSNFKIISSFQNTNNTTVYEATNKLNSHINGLKSKLYQFTDNIPEEVADTISLYYIAAKDNYDVPTHILGIADPNNPSYADGLEECSAITLREKIEKFNAIVLELNPNSKTINTKDYTNYNGYMDPWEVETFYHYTISQVILTLNQIQLEANIICNTTLTSNLLQQTNNQQPDTIN